MAKEINVVIIGETGSGKSTFINYLANLFFDGSLTNLKVAIPTKYLSTNLNYLHNEDDLDDDTKSKTLDCQCYTFQIGNVNFNFIDTPGINDTGGYLQDNENVDKIFDTVQTLDYLTALVLVLNGTQARMTINIKNVLERFRDRIPDIIYNNMIVILTNCQSHTVNFNPKTIGLSSTLKCSVFYMQNSAFSSDSSQWDPMVIQILQRDWHISVQTMNDIIKKLISLTSVSTETFKTMQDDRNTIRSLLHESRLMIMEIQQLEDEIIGLEQASDIYGSNVEKYQNAVKQKGIMVNEVTVTPYHNTICLNCNQVCHERCSLTETTKVGEKVFQRCAVIGSNGKCTVCKGHCSFDNHYHDRKLITPIQRTLKAIANNIYERSLTAKADKEKVDIKCETVQETKKLIENALHEQYVKVKESCYRVKNTCKGFNVVEELYIFVSFLKIDCNSLNSQSVVRRATRFIEKLEKLCNNLQDDFTADSSSSTSPNMDKREKSRSTTKSLLDLDIPTAKSGKPSLMPSPTLTNETEKIFSSYHSLTEKSSADDVYDKNDTKRSTTDGRRQPVYPNESLLTRSTDDRVTRADPLGKCYYECSNEKLIEISRGIREQKSTDCKEIQKELSRRCGGTSVGYLSNNKLFTLCEQFSNCRNKSVEELYKLHGRLQQEIQELIDHDPYDILAVPSDKLLHLAAVNLLIQNPRRN
ncbi:unnamed protein product [Didymodactylos carnosus]|uniref:G domain-containing protein n=1 Tax=Didymodactylos carnosus TaxID=1234261 RepID=A0A814WF05_9BILA|nr:unnamed protein product [Didymodactylos carnosus]CAF3965956.1 unnamed protein product [Didymodactylos carnosus]